MLGGGAKLGKEVAPALRFSGWEKIGAQTRPADTRTTAQLLENIDFKILVKDTILINSFKEQSDRYLFTLENSRIFEIE